MQIGKFKLGLKKDFVLSLVFFFLILTSINLALFPHDQGFVNLSPHPYLVAILLLAGRFGLKEGLLAATVSAILLFLQGSLLGPEMYREHPTLAAYGVPFLSFFLAAVIVGELREISRKDENRLIQLKEKLEAENTRLKEQLLAVTQVKEEFERRIIGQEATVHSLYKAAKSLETLKEEEVYRGLLRMTAQFTGATKVSLYMADYTEDTIHLVAVHGWESTIHHLTTAKVGQGIFGWLIEHGEILTVREINREPELQAYWQELSPKSMAYVPLMMGHVLVGVLTVDEIPFLKLSLPTLRILAMIADLAVPAINNVIKFQDLKERDMVDRLTELHNYRYFLDALDSEFKRTVRNHLDLTLLIFEIDSLGSLERQYGADTRDLMIRIVGRLIKRFLRDIDLACVGRQRGRFYVMLPLTSIENAMKVSQRIQEKLQHAARYFKEDHLAIKLNMGFSTYRPYVKTKEALVKLAEQSLKLAKVSVAAAKPETQGQDEDIPESTVEEESDGRS